MELFHKIFDALLKIIILEYSELWEFNRYVNERIIIINFENGEHFIWRKNKVTYVKF